MPMITPPLTWLSVVNWLMMSPQSCTAVTRLTVTRPVSVSTATSANCTPPAPLDDKPCCHLPLATSGVTPSFLQAEGQFLPRTSGRPDCFCKSANAFWQASNTAGETEAHVVL